MEYSKDQLALLELCREINKDAAELKAIRETIKTLETPQTIAEERYEFCDYHRTALEQSLSDM